MRLNEWSPDCSVSRRPAGLVSDVADVIGDPVQNAVAISPFKVPFALLEDGLGSSVIVMVVSASSKTAETEELLESLNARNVR